MLEIIFSDLSFLKVFLYAVGGCALYSIITGILENRHINALGGRAPVRKSYLPLGLDTLYKVVTSSLRHDQLGFWLDGFKKFGSSGNPWTVEAQIGGQRLVLTADPDNIKAILATQFNDYGKGEEFNKHWHDFLGDSIL
jgi:hypothetical protein